MTKGIVRDQQLASLVAEEISLILCSASDSRLSELIVTRVDSGPGGKNFVVYVAPESDAQSFTSCDDVKAVLERARGFLRASLASAMNLKRAPELKLALDPLYILAARRFS